MPLSNNLKQKIVNMVTGRLNSVSISQVFVGLSTTTPSGDGTNITEPSDTAYKRVMLGNSGQSLTQKMSAATDATPSSANTEPILFDKATSSWGTITHVVFYDAQTSGNFLGYAALNSSVSVSSGNVARIAIGDLTVSIS